MIVVALMTIVMVWLQLLAVRGGAFHGLMISELAKAFTAAGWETRTEHPIRLRDGRMDAVDLLVRRPQETLAVEVETTTRSVLVNVEKARLAELPLMIVVPTWPVHRAVQRLLDRHAEGQYGHSRILLYSQLLQALTSPAGIDSLGVLSPGKGEN